jgi:hypothetical protein
VAAEDGMMSSKWLKFTEPDNREVWVNAEHVQRVRFPVAGEHATAKTALDFDGTQYVMEPIDVVIRMLVNVND